MPDPQLGQAVLVSAVVSLEAMRWARCCRAWVMDASIASARSRAMRYATSGRGGGPVMRNPLASMGLHLLGGVESVHGAHLAAPSGAEHVLESSARCFEPVVGVA